MKIAVIADSHYSEESRFAECVRLHDWIAQDAADRGCTAWLHAGDVYERRSTPTERAAVADWVRTMTTLVGPGVIVAGNHDAPGDLSLLARLELPASLEVVEDARVVEVMDDDGNGCLVACVAWPHRSGLAARSEDGTIDATEDATREALRSVLRGLRGDMADYRHWPRVLLAHAMVRGSMTSTGQPLIGHAMELGLEDLALVEADAYLLGHIHMPQDWSIGEAPVIYPGSPRRTSFGELERKGYVILDTEEPAAWQHIATPATPMLHVDGEWVPEHVALPGDVVVPAFLRVDDVVGVAGAEIRLRYHVAPEHRAAARREAEEARARWLTLGAALVKVEEVVHAETRARAPELAEASTLADQLRALWRSRGQADDDAQAQRLLQRLASLEERAA